MRIMRIIGLCAVLSGLSAAAFSDAIYLKSGNVIEGNILQTNNDWTMIRTGVRTLKYDADQIEKIEKDDGGVAVNPKDEELTDDKRALIKGLLEANGVAVLIQKNIDNVLAKAPADRRDELKGLFQKEVLMDLLIPVYAETFTSRELEKMVNFFNSPAGQKFVEVSPVVLDKTFKVLVDYFKTHSAL